MDAKRVAHKLGIEHKILYYQDKFKQGVIDNFVDSYLNGETPIPCVQCNQTVKFKDLFEVSKDLNADALVTGHYVKNVTANNTNNMYRACLLYTSDAADEEDSVDLGGRRIIKKKNKRDCKRAKFKCC